MFSKLFLNWIYSKWCCFENKYPENVYIKTKNSKKKVFLSCKVSFFFSDKARAMSMVMSEQPLGCFLSWESVRPHPVYQMMCPFSLLLGDYNPHLRCCCFMSGIAFARIACKPLKTNCPLTPDCECTAFSVLYVSMQFKTYQYTPIHLIVLQSNTCWQQTHVRIKHSSWSSVCPLLFFLCLAPGHKMLLNNILFSKYLLQKANVASFIYPFSSSSQVFFVQPESRSKSRNLLAHE